VQSVAEKVFPFILKKIYSLSGLISFKITEENVGLSEEYVPEKKAFSISNRYGFYFVNRHLVSDNILVLHFEFSNNIRCYTRRLGIHTPLPQTHHASAPNLARRLSQP
jgi:hypothetical protein